MRRRFSAVLLVPQSKDNQTAFKAGNTPHAIPSATMILQSNSMALRSISDEMSLKPREI
jgi:hypothetical protein